MKKDKSRIRQQIRRSEEARADPLDKILNENRPLRRGSFLTIHRKCGKPNCHCTGGEGHEAKYLSTKEGGRTRMIFIPPHLELRVADEAWRYRRFRKARAQLAKLAKQSLQLIDELEKTLESSEEIPSKRKKNDKSPCPSRKRNREQS